MIGKIIGGVVFLMIGGPLLGLIGIWVGHMFDKARRSMANPVSGEERSRVQQTFFNTLFLLLGYVAKADGRISEVEISLTESLMSKMGLTAEHRREAIRLFKAGAEPGFNPDASFATFRQDCARSPNLTQMLLVYLINLAMADGALDQAEVNALTRIAEGLGFSRFAFEQILRMIQAQNRFGGERAQQPRIDELAVAYEALGVSANASDADVKKAWRKLMSEYHPDKLMGQGMPADMVKEATERSQEIQAAYDLIKKSRKS